MKCLLWRKLRIPVYCIILFVIVKLVYYMFLDDTAEKERHLQVKRIASVRQHSHRVVGQERSNLKLKDSNDFDGFAKKDISHTLPNYLESSLQKVRDDVDVKGRSNVGKDEFGVEDNDKYIKVNKLESSEEVESAKDVTAPAEKTTVSSDSLWGYLDERLLPSWYDEAKFGIFIHWGVFSVPSFSDEKFWWKWKGPKPDSSIMEFMKKNFPADITYKDFAKNFTAEFFNATEWAVLFQRSGARYVVLTSKHHEGYAMWPASTSKMWNSFEVGPHKDLVGLLSKAIKSKTDLRFGLYYSLFEWFHGLYLEDKHNGFNSSKYVVNRVLPELKNLVTNYEPEVIFSDGDFGPAAYWNSAQFLNWLYSESKVKDTVVTNDRWGDETHCKHGGYILCEEGYNANSQVKRKWEKCASIDKLSWGYRRNVVLKQLLTTEEILKMLVTTVSKGGNLLLNIGPTKEGTITPVFQERLLQVGQWLQVNGEAIYSTSPWLVNNDSYTSDVWYTAKNLTIYAFGFSLPKDDIVILQEPVPSNASKVYLLGWDGVGLTWNYTDNGVKKGVKIKLPRGCWLQGICKWVFVLKLLHFK